MSPQSQDSVKGQQVGPLYFREDRPLIIVSLMAAQRELALKNVAEIAAAGADVIEWRVDYSVANAADALKVAGALPEITAAAAGVPLILTLRSGAEGGSLSLGEPGYQQMVDSLIEIADPSRHVVDIEQMRAGAAELLAHAKHCGLATIGSYHNCAGTPTAAEIDEIIAEQAHMGFDILKVAANVHSEAEALTLMSAGARARVNYRKPCLVIGMGKLGRITRLGGPAVGASATFACWGDAPGAPGQMSLAALKKFWQDDS